MRWIGIGCSGSEAEIVSSVVTAEKWESGFPREALKSADEALYAAKNNGRNHVLKATRLDDREAA